MESRQKWDELLGPAKLQSYMACGTAILVAAGGESARVVQEAKCGFVCEQDADKLTSVIRNDVISSCEMNRKRSNAKQYFDEHFSMDLVIDQFEKMLESGCSERE